MDFSLAGGAIAAAAFVARVLPAAFEEVGAGVASVPDSAGELGGAPGIVMSRSVTEPRVESGLSNSAGFQTTSKANLPGWTYFSATRATSACVTFSIPARYCSKKSDGYS